MKRLLLLLLLLLPSPAAAQYSSQIQAALRNFPNPYASDPVTCSSTSLPRMYYNTTTNKINYCNGTAWVELDSGSDTISIVSFGGVGDGVTDNSTQAQAGAPACIIRWDTAVTEVSVLCTDATADKCLCAG